MKILFLFPLFVIVTLLCIGLFARAHEENEFAEFEDDFAELGTDAPEVQIPRPDQKQQQATTTTKRPPTTAQRQEGREEFDDDDFGVVDEDDNEEVEEQKERDPDEAPAIAPLKFADVPAHFRSNWASYQVEAIVLVVILIYVINYLIGRTTNSSIAHSAFDHLSPILIEQFALVSDDGTSEIETIEPVLRRDTDYCFSSWCTGRVSVNSLHLQMRMVKRQDLVSRVMNIFDPVTDRLTFKIQLESAHDTDPIVLAIGEKKTVVKNVKDMLDLATFASERKQTASQFNLPANFSLYADQNEVVYSVLEPGIVTLLKKHEPAIELIHISDQYTGPKPPDGETYTRLPEPQRYMTVVLDLAKCNEKETLEELLNLIFYLIEKVRRLKLSKEAKYKAEKRRKEFEEAFLKTTHQFRQEAAQARREEKTRERKQKLLDESDPDRQKRLEAKELKREAKAKQPKMKQLKMK